MSPPFTLQRTSGADLALTAQHDLLSLPRKGTVDWSALDAAAYDEPALAAARKAWLERARQELHSLALFTELASQLQVLGAPLDWSGAFARMIADEVRHTDLCLRLVSALGGEAAPSIDPAGLHLLGGVAARGSVRRTIVAAFCIGETLSGRMFRRCLRVTTVPLARQVVSAIWSTRPSTPSSAGSSARC